MAATRSGWMGLGLLALWGLTAPASAATSLRIPPGDLIAALEDLGRQSGAEIVYEPKQLRGLRTQGVSQPASPEDAVRALIRGARLALHVDSTGAMLISADSDPTPTRVLDRPSPDRRAQ